MKIWSTFVQPAVLYATEIMTFPESVMRKIEVAHHRILRSILDLPQYTPVQALYTMMLQVKTSLFKQIALNISRITILIISKINSYFETKQQSSSSNKIAINKQGNV